MSVIETVEQLEAIKAAALQPDVEEHEVRPTAFDLVQGRVAVARRARAIALILEQARDEFANVSLVIDDENIRRHRTYRSLVTLALSR